MGSAERGGCAEQRSEFAQVLPLVVRVFFVGTPVAPDDVSRAGMTLLCLPVSVVVIGERID